MIGLDTNILIRYLTLDDPVQSAQAAEIIEQKLSVANPGFISIVTIAEMAWVLDRAYGFTDMEIAAAIERMLQVEVLIVENRKEVFVATVALKQGRAAFADALIAELGVRAGCSHTLTFDKKALRFPHSSFHDATRVLEL